METTELTQTNGQENIENNLKGFSLKPWIIAITVILSLMLILNVYLLIKDNNQSQRKAELLETVEKHVKQQQTDINLLQIDYNKTVYDNPRVDNINKQLLLSQEFTFDAITLLAEQNQYLIEMIANFP